MFYMLFAQDDLAPTDHTRLLNAQPQAAIEVGALAPHNEAIAQEVRGLKRILMVNGTVTLLGSLLWSVVLFELYRLLRNGGLNITVTVPQA